MDRRPKLQLIAAGPSPEETAAIVAALTAHLAESQATLRVAPTPSSDRQSPWLRAALLGGVSQRCG